MAMAGFQTPAWASMPMPSGWEAKYDPNVGRYFFINHLTKKTQWSDPRQTAYEAQQRRSPQPPRAQHIPMQPIAKPKCKTCKRNEVDSAGMMCQACAVAQQQREIELMRAREQMEEEKRRREQQAKLEKERERRRVQSAKRRQEHAATSDVLETAFGEEVEVDKDALKEEVRKMFPKTEREIIDMILETCSWDKEKTVQSLVSMGETRVVPQKSPKKAAQPTSTIADASVNLTKHQKDQIKAKLVKHFPHASELMVNMALETTKFDEIRARAVLHMLKEDNQGQPSSTSESQSVEVTFPSTMPTPTPTTVASSKASRGGSATSTASLSGVQVSLAVASPKRSQQPPQSKLIGSPAKRTAKIPSSITKMAPRMGPKKFTTKTPGGSRHAVLAVQPSDYTTEAKGSDPSLVTGPNLDNLIDNYQPAFGPDKDFVQGPNKENVMGPGGAWGRDPSLASGPDPASISGPEPGLAKGSMY